MKNMHILKSDVLVIGHGLAGLRAAYEAASQGASVIVAGKGKSASPEIMGYNAAHLADDSTEQLYQDIIVSGCGINDTALARTMAEQAQFIAEDLVNIGLEPSRNPDGSYNTMKTLGCKYSRIIHTQSYTGAKASTAYQEAALQLGVVFHSPVAVVELLTEGSVVAGAAGIRTDTGEFVIYQAKAIVLATGGCGDNFPVTTYPAGINGDGYAMAFRAGAALVDMEFMQYEPCCFLHPGQLVGEIAVTTMLREGGVLRDGQGQEFMPDGYDVQKPELAWRIASQVRDGRGSPHGGVYYDVTALSEKRVAIDHAMFYNPAKACGIDLTKDWAEVGPVAHTCIGGVAITTKCETTLPGLFAAGEVVGGIHGANRIGGCAGTETMVFGKIAGIEAARYAAGQTKKKPEISRERVETMFAPKGQEKAGAEVFHEFAAAIRTDIQAGLGIIKTETELLRMCDALHAKSTLMDCLYPVDSGSFLLRRECQNMILVAKLQARAALLRKESRGVFFRADYPEMSRRYTCRIALCKQGASGIETNIMTVE